MSGQRPVVYVVDDDKAVRESLRWLIEAEDLAVETFAAAEALLSLTAFAACGCVVADLRMPGMSGLDLQRELKKRGAALPLIVITGHGEVAVAVRAMKEGAFDFLEKPLDDGQFLDVARRAIAYSQDAGDDRRCLTEVRRRLGALTARERQVLDLIVAGQPNKCVAYALGISDKTVEAHRARIMSKMAAGSFAELVGGVVRASANGSGHDTDTEKPLWQRPAATA